METIQLSVIPFGLSQGWIFIVPQCSDLSILRSRRTNRLFCRLEHVRLRQQILTRISRNKGFPYNMKLNEPHP